MTTIVYIDPDGLRHDVPAEAGSTVMAVAVKSGVPGIVAECGGSLSCASCHVYVEPEWIDVVGAAADELELEMLDGALAELEPGSRLSCQVPVTEEMDGLVVRVPADQI